MTLQQIKDTLDANIETNKGTLRLAQDTIDSKDISNLFNTYLLGDVLVVTDAQSGLVNDCVTVTGKGDSLLFFGMNIALSFTMVNDVPSLKVAAEAVIAEQNGWTFGASFPVLRYTNWGGFPDPADPKQWIQYLFFSSAKLTLSEERLSFDGAFLFEKGLAPLSVLFGGGDRAEVTGEITLNKGDKGYKVTADTVVPEMELTANIGIVQVPVGNFSFKLSFALKASAFLLPEGDQKGRPVPVLETLLQSTIPINGKDVGIGVSVGTTIGIITMRALLPENTEIGLSELVTLANNANILSALPSNLPIIDNFALRDWCVSFDPRQKQLLSVSIVVATRTGFSWNIIPDVLELQNLCFWISAGFGSGTFDPALTLEATVGIGKPPSQVQIELSAFFPGYVFCGSLDPETPVDLQGILIHFLGEPVGATLPDTLQIGVLNLTADPKNRTYSAEIVLTTDLKIPTLLPTSLVVQSVQVNVNYVAGAATGAITGNLRIEEQNGDAPELFVTAAYKGSDEGWVFSGGLADGSALQLKTLIGKFLPAQYHSFDASAITIKTLFVSFTQGKVRKYEFRIGAEWTLDVGLPDPIKITAKAEIACDGSKPTNSEQYSGFIEGSLDLGNILVGARVDFKDKSNAYTFFFNGFFATLNKQGDDQIICFSVTNETSLGDLISLLVNAAIGQEVTLPSPWNVVNNIRLKDFGLTFNLTQKEVGVVYTTSIDLGFIKIEELSLTYRFANGQTNAPAEIKFGITKGSFLGGAKKLPEPWDVLDPAAAPDVPGQGEQLFRLDFLGLGQHVALKDNLTSDSVQEAVEALAKAFKRDSALRAAQGSPISATGLKFSSSGNWLIATKFVVVETFGVGIVFFDPVMYGLSFYVDGPKAKVFQGLRFEIMYKKVSDTVGLYMIYLKLPDTIRQIDFGSVSVTLPSIRLYIYTNGDFKVDLGFPLNDDFSESFGVQWLPFIGSGGFYIGFLSNDSAATLPTSKKGNFSPVVVFGIGLQVGVGKEINKGILKAGISITVQGIFEGIFAQFNAFEGDGQADEPYYYVQGKASLVGHVFGAVEFVVISAALDLRVFVSVRLVLEAHEPTVLALSAGVSVSLKIDVNLGLFSTSINCSYDTTIEESFTIGQHTVPPWSSQSLSAPFRRVPLRALNVENACPEIPVMNWQPVYPVTRVPLEIWFIPQFTVATEDGTGQQARVVAQLYLDSSIDRSKTKKSVCHSDGEPPEEEDFPFTKLAKGVFLWTLGAFINQTQKPVPVEDVLKAEIDSAVLNRILCFFSQEQPLEPFTWEQAKDFLSMYLDITVTIPPRQSEEERQVSVFPVLPFMVLKTPTGNKIYFDNARAPYVYDTAQLKLIRDYFRQLAVRDKNKKKASPDSVDEPGNKQSLATFMVIDYLSLLARESIRQAIDLLGSQSLTVEAGLNLNDFATQNGHYGISAEELAFSNRTRPLRSDLSLKVSGMRYTVRHGDSVEGLAQRFGLATDALYAANAYAVRTNIPQDSPAGKSSETVRYRAFDERMHPVPGETLQLPDFLHRTSSLEPESLLDVANHYGVPVRQLISDNLSVDGLFPEGSRIRIPFAEKMTVQKMIATMENHHCFEHLSGLSANMMLQGLRVPLPEKESGIGKPAALYKVTGQEIDGSAIQPGQELDLMVESALDWLHLGTTGTNLAFTFLKDDVDAIQKLEKSKLSPSLLELKPLALCDVQHRRYPLPVHIDWQLPESVLLFNGNNRLAATNDPAIWDFRNNLQSLISGKSAIAPKVRLLKEVQETLSRAGNPAPVTEYSWSTRLTVQLRQIKSAKNPAMLMPNVYEVQGINQDAMPLLQAFLEYVAEHPDQTLVDRIDILYTKEPAKAGQEAPPNGLCSDAIANSIVFLLQNNLSFLSDPPKSRKDVLARAADSQENLAGMASEDFLKRLWEASVTGSGGYLLYYQVKDSKAGLPDYLFNSEKVGEITLVITYNITDDILHGFINSVVIREQVDVSSELLYVETMEQTVNAVALSDTYTLHSLAHQWRSTPSRIAARHAEHLLKPGIQLRIPKRRVIARPDWDMIDLLNMTGVTETQWKAVNSGVSMGAEHPGELITLPVGTYVTQPGDRLADLASRFHTSVISLASANMHVANLFTGLLPFDSRIEVKVATVPPGSIGFTMTREATAKRCELSQEENALEHLYNLLEYNIAENADFKHSDPGLPVAPFNTETTGARDTDLVKRPTAETNGNWNYKRIVPVSSFVKTISDTSLFESRLPALIGQLSGCDHPLRHFRKLNDDIPPDDENPYRAVGRTAQIDLRWNDIFGNQTLFDNSASGEAVSTLPPIPVGYIDPVIGLDRFPSVSVAYIVDRNGSNDSPVMDITLAFNPVKYQSSGDENDSWKERARADRDTYQRIYYQLLQNDVSVTLYNSLQNGSLFVKADDPEPKAVLVAFVLEIYQYLGELLGGRHDTRRSHEVQQGECLTNIAKNYRVPVERIVGVNPGVPLDHRVEAGQVLRIPEASIPADKHLILPLSDTNVTPLFALSARIRIARDSDLVDEGFKDEASVCFAETKIAPNLKKPEAEQNGQGDTTITLADFTKKLESAFPELKVAAGIPKVDIEHEPQADLWVVRFQKSPNGICFSKTGNPFFFALPPLSTHLLSEKGVPIYDYVSGELIDANLPTSTDFSDIDLDRLAKDFLSAVDLFLQADFSIPAWLVEYPATGAEQPYEDIIEAKRTLAKNISAYLDSVLDITIPSGNREDARQRLMQQLLINLSDAYSIDTVVQLDVDVQSPYNDPAVIAPNLFGKVVASDDSNGDEKAYAFSTARFSLKQSSTDHSFLTLLFNTRKEGVANQSYFPVSLCFKINSLEHDIVSVKGIDGYKASSWLTFVRPDESTNIDLGDLNIPVPLRSYPTAPSLTGQSFFLPSTSESDELTQAKKWGYRYTYEYALASQDQIDTEISLNVAQAKNVDTQSRQDEPDLYEALLQFTSAYPAIQQDFVKYLIPLSDLQKALTALQSFAWLVVRVAKAWGRWHEDKARYSKRENGELQYCYKIKEDSYDQHLRVTVTSLADVSVPLPSVLIDGYEKETLPSDSNAMSFVYCKTDKYGKKSYLSMEEGRRNLRRNVELDGLNIILQENAWAGLAVSRNEMLVPYIQTNNKFIYRTPSIRFANMLTPLLEPDINIDIASFTKTAQEKKYPLSLLLSNFLRELFKELPSEPKTDRQIKISSSYSYMMATGISVLLPIGLIIPCTFNIPDDFKVSACLEQTGSITQDSFFVCQFSAMLKQWFTDNKPADSGGRFIFDLSLFSGITKSQLPVLHIRRLFLSVNIIDFISDYH